MRASPCLVLMLSYSACAYPVLPRNVLCQWASDGRAPYFLEETPSKTTLYRRAFMPKDPMYGSYKKPLKIPESMKPGHAYDLGDSQILPFDPTSKIVDPKKAQGLHSTLHESFGDGAGKIAGPVAPGHVYGGVGLHGDAASKQPVKMWAPWQFQVPKWHVEPFVNPWNPITPPKPKPPPYIGRQPNPVGIVAEPRNAKGLHDADHLAFGDGTGKHAEPAKPGHIYGGVGLHGDADSKKPVNPRHPYRWQFSAPPAEQEHYVDHRKKKQQAQVPSKVSPERPPPVHTKPDKLPLARPLEALPPRPHIPDQHLKPLPQPPHSSKPVHHLPDHSKPLPPLPGQSKPLPPLSHQSKPLPPLPHHMKPLPPLPHDAKPLPPPKDPAVPAPPHPVKPIHSKPQSSSPKLQWMSGFKLTLRPGRH